MKPKMPALVVNEGALIANAGRYARETVMTVFEMIGGAERMAHEANRDPKWFYEKLFAKIITKEVEVQSSAESVDDLILAARDVTPIDDIA